MEKKYVVIKSNLEFEPDVMVYDKTHIVIADTYFSYEITTYAKNITTAFKRFRAGIKQAEKDKVIPASILRVFTFENTLELDAINATEIRNFFNVDSSSFEGSHMFWGLDEDGIADDNGYAYFYMYFKAYYAPYDITVDFPITYNEVEDPYIAEEIAIEEMTEIVNETRRLAKDSVEYFGYELHDLFSKVNCDAWNLFPTLDDRKSRLGYIIEHTAVIRKIMTAVNAPAPEISEPAGDLSDNALAAANSRLAAFNAPAEIRGAENNVQTTKGVTTMKFPSTFRVPDANDLMSITRQIAGAPIFQTAPEKHFDFDTACDVTVYTDGFLKVSYYTCKGRTGELAKFNDTIITARLETRPDPRFGNLSINILLTPVVLTVNSDATGHKYYADMLELTSNDAISDFVKSAEICEVPAESSVQTSRNILTEQ